MSCVRADGDWYWTQVGAFRVNACNRSLGLGSQMMEKRKGYAPDLMALNYLLHACNIV